MGNTFVRLGLAALMVAATLVAVFALRGGLLKPVRGGDFALQSADGPVSLENFRGKVVLIYFGYTYCPDACPTSLSIMTQAFNSLTPSELEKVQGILISVDPERDSPERLKEYAAYFHPQIIGATGDVVRLALLATQYGAQFRSQKVDSAAGYLVDHTSEIYLVDRRGELVHSFPHATPANVIVEELRKWL